MARSIAVAWRTCPDIATGVVEYCRINEDAGGVLVERADMRTLECPELRDDVKTHNFSATLRDLFPGVTYRYRVGCGAAGDWSEWRSFTTAAEAASNLSFVYLGDTQIGPDSVGEMLRGVESRHPGVAFYAIGGDLVDMGEMRNLWDNLLVHTGDVFSRKPVVSCRGNHDTGEGINAMAIYRNYFNPHPTEGSLFPDSISYYSFPYGPAYFIVLDSNARLGEQREWLEKELEKASHPRFSFKIVMFHHPVYNVKYNRFDTSVLREWGALLDRYAVDLVLTGHDHSYMRSMKMRAGIPVADGGRGTTFVVATGCRKYSRHRRIAFAEKQFGDVQTYQHVEIDRDGEGKARLRYTAYSAKGEKMDEFAIRK